MKGWVLSQEGDMWSVRFDVRDLGGNLDTTFRRRSSTLAARVRLVIFRLFWFLFFLWIFMVGSVWSGLCIFLLLCMGLRLLCLLLTACAGFGTLS